jgi:hypothetical protein
MCPSIDVGGMYNDCFVRGKMWCLPSAPEHAMLLITLSISQYVSCPMPNSQVAAAGKSGRKA